MTFVDNLVPFDDFSRWADVGVLLAVSGGADSVAMLRCFAEHTRRSPKSKPLVHVAHVNHALRGDESDGDAAFVRELAAGFDFAYHETRLTADELATDESGSFEAAARGCRYDFLQHTAEQNSLRYVAVAHNADDQAETILHRIIRGTGVAGLAGIPAFRPLGAALTLIRPMLPHSRQRILDYLASVNQSFRTDSTNAETCYTRNKIRNDLLPQLASGYNHAVAESLIRLGSQAAEWDAYIKSQTEALFDRAVVCRSCEVVIQLEALADQPPLIVRELFVMIWSRQHWHLRDMTFAHWERLAQLAQSHANVRPQADVRQPLKRFFPGAIIAERMAERIVLSIHNPAGTVTE